MCCATLSDLLISSTINQPNKSASTDATLTFSTFKLSSIIHQMNVNDVCASHLPKLRRLRVHHRQLHPPTRDIERIWKRLGKSASKAAAQEFRRDAEHESTYKRIVGSGGGASGIKESTNLCSSPVCCTCSGASTSCTRTSGPRSSRTKGRRKEPFPWASARNLCTAPARRLPPSVCWPLCAGCRCTCARPSLETLTARGWCRAGKLKLRRWVRHRRQRRIYQSVECKASDREVLRNTETRKPSWWWKPNGWSLTIHARAQISFLTFL